MQESDYAPDDRPGEVLRGIRKINASPIRSGLCRISFGSWFPLVPSSLISSLRQMQAAAQAIRSEKQASVTGKENKITFQDVAGIDEAKRNCRKSSNS